MASGYRDGMWRPVISGLCAVLIGIGLGRFAYTPLIPALVAEGWFRPSDAAYLGAANLAGYLAGALSARSLARHMPLAFVLRATLLAAAAAFFACAFPAGFAWFFVWRFVAGWTGGVLMALGASAAVAAVPVERRGLAGGVVFTGVGLGIALSGTLVPLLLRKGLTATWLALGLVALILTAIAWNGWTTKPGAVRAGGKIAEAGPQASLRWALLALCAVYALNAAGSVPHMIFLVDFVARGLGRGIDVGARYWVLFGLGALVGSLIAGRLADRIGFTAALRVALLVQAAAVALLTLTTSSVALAASSIAVGMFVPGVVPLVLGRVQELVGADIDAQRAAWSLATAAFAMGQAGAGYGFSLLFAQHGYALMFDIAFAVFTLALLAELAAAAIARPTVRRDAI
jgi:predicted MFS family arabinose efflux permease